MCLLGVPQHFLEVTRLRRLLRGCRGLERRAEAFHAIDRDRDCKLAFVESLPALWVSTAGVQSRCVQEGKVVASMEEVGWLAAKSREWCQLRGGGLDRWFGHWR